MSESDAHDTQYQEGPADPGDEQIPRNNNSDNNERMYDVSYKVILIGDSGEGKSNVLARFTK
jgi:GTPase SAR1 family protein